MSSTPSDKRPTSPHLSIYRPQITTVLSITHRMTGIALTAGMAVIVLWMWSAAYAPGFFATLHGLLASPIGQILLIGWMLAFFFHLSSGIRHLFWDMGKGFALPTATRSGWAVVILTLVLTAFSTGVIYASMGASQ